MVSTDYTGRLKKVSLFDNRIAQFNSYQNQLIACIVSRKKYYINCDISQL